MLLHIYRLNLYTLKAFIDVLSSTQNKLLHFFLLLLDLRYSEQAGSVNKTNKEHICLYINIVMFVVVITLWTNGPGVYL